MATIQHAELLGHAAVHVGDQRVVHLAVRVLLDVLLPEVVIFERVDAQADDLRLALLELRLQLRQSTELGGADRREVFRVREENAPAVVEVLVQLEEAGGGEHRRVWKLLTDSQHGAFVVVGGFGVFGVVGGFEVVIGFEVLNLENWRDQNDNRDG